VADVLTAPAHRRSAPPRSASARRQPSSTSCVPGPTKRAHALISSNTVKSYFGETCRPVKVIGRLPGETNCTSQVRAVLVRASGAGAMAPAGLRLLQVMRRALLENRTSIRHASAPNADEPDSFGVVA
jgi:hypothetical protein